MSARRRQLDINMTRSDLAALLPQFISIPRSPFLMGTPEHALRNLARQFGGTRESYREETPQHTLMLAPYAIARVPVTNALYAAYVADSGTPPPHVWRGSQPPAERIDHPVVDVSWDDARSFCRWLSAANQLPIITAGAEAVSAAADVPAVYRLPSEAEWEHAARGSDGRHFPWGNEVDQRANTRERGLATTSSVGAYPEAASPYGALDMAGNVWEWTESCDALYPYRPDDGREDEWAKGRRILRGGCYANPIGFARCACRFRLDPKVRNEFTGFRLAVDL